MEYHEREKINETAGLSERDRLLIQTQGPRIKPILRAIALLVAETFLVTQVAWATDYRSTRAIYDLFKARRNYTSPFPKVETLQEQNDMILDRQNATMDAGGLADETAGATTDLFSRSVLEQLESEPVERPLNPALVAQSMGQYKGDGEVQLAALSTPLGAQSLILPGSGQALPPLVEGAAPETFAAEKDAELSAKTDRQEEAGFLELDPIRPESAQALRQNTMEDRLDSATFQSSTESYLDTLHAFGRASLKAFLAEIVAFEALVGAKGEDAEGGKEGESVQMASAQKVSPLAAIPVEDVTADIVPAEDVTLSKVTEPTTKQVTEEPFETPPGEDFIEEQGQTPPFGEGEIEEDPFDDPFFGDNENGDLFDDPFFGDDYEFPGFDEETTTPGGAPQTWLSNGGTYQETLVGEDGQTISNYDVTIQVELAIVNNRLVVVGEVKTYRYTNADGTTGEEKVEWHYTFDEEGNISGKERVLFKNGWVPDREEKTAPVYYDNVTVRETSEVERDESGRITRYETTYLQGDKKIHYVIEVDQYDTADQRAEWREITEIVDIGTGETLTIETIGTAEGYDAEGRMTGYTTTTHVFAEGVDPETIEAIRPQLEALATAFSNLGNFLTSKQGALTGRDLSKNDKAVLDGLIQKATDAIGALKGMENLPAVVQSLVNKMEQTIADLKGSITEHRHERRHPGPRGDSDTMVWYTYGIAADKLTNFVDAVKQYSILSHADSFLSQTDYTITTEVRNIQYGMDNMWLSYAQTTTQTGIAELPDGTVVRYNRTIEIVQTPTLDENGLLIEATVTVTTTYGAGDLQYDSVNSENNVIVETFNRTDMTYEHGLVIGDQFYQWDAIKTALIPLLGITDETFTNGVVDAQSFLDALGMDLDLASIVDSAPEGIGPDQIDQLVFDLLTTFIFEAMTGGGLSQETRQGFIDSIVQSVDFRYSQQISRLNRNIRSIDTKFRRGDLTPEEREALE
ncbi:MAG: hypothetical protein ABH845_04485, partial [Candidatus Omnitrophota bacterium]